MANFATTLENNLLKHILGVATYTPGSLTIALYTTAPTMPAGTGGVETTYTNYARASVPSSIWGTAASGSVTNSITAVAFPACGATGATIVGWGIFDSVGLILSGACSLAVSSGITPQFNTSTLTVSIA